MEELDFLLDTFTWSFSRLNSFDNCEYEWWCNYIECYDKENGAFAEYGKFIHEILEKYSKGELSIFELNDYYEEHFNEEIPHDFPPNKYVDLRKAYYDKGLEYLNNINLDFDKYEILGVEKKVEFEIAGKKFIGFIDLLLREKENDRIVILDHKSASLKILKNGNISKSDQTHFLEFKRQLYLYGRAVREEYGEVSKLIWNMFRDQKWICIDWNEEEYNEAVEWAENQIKRIEETKEFHPNPDYFYCNYLCSQRNNCCPYKSQPIAKEDDRFYNPETKKYE